MKTPTTLSEKDLKAVIARRDRRFDGRFYFGVKTTRIYCRPVCPARPKPENILIFRSHSEAEGRGYRPCLRCRPDAAPGSKLLDGTANTVARALRIIQDAGGEGAEDLSVERLAETLGVTDRHLRRLFDEHLGASPIEIMVTQRLHFARQALRETSLPISEIAFAAGFRSIRRFNEAFKERFRVAPSEYRIERSSAAQTGAGIELEAPIRLPYDWDSVITYLHRHETFGVELVEGGTYRRFVPRGKDGFGSVVVSRQGAKDFLSVRFFDIPLSEIRVLLGRIKVLFDTDHNPADIPAAAGAGGIRVPASIDPFETAVSIILSQLVSTANAKTTLRRLVERFGRRIGTFEDRPVYEFPQPRALVDARIEEIGLTKVKAGAIRELARAVAAREIDFKAHVEFAEATQRLLAIRGIGPWTAAMIAMRCLGNPDAFPDQDLVVRRVVEAKRIDQADWGSFRAYLVHCLWRDSKKEEV